MSRAFVKDANDERWQPPEETSEFAVYLRTPGGAFERSPVRQGNDLNALLRWAASQPRGSFQIRHRAGQRLADLPEQSARS